MSLSIRHWLAERHIERRQLGHDSAQIAGIAFRLAQDMEVKSLNPFAISPLTDVLELPLTAAWEAAPALSQLSIGLLRILSRKKPLKRNEGTWLTFQVAYLNALQGILEQESQLRRPWVNRALVPAGQDADQSLSDPQLVALLKTLRPGRLSDSQAEQALSLVADSFLVQQMNNLAIAWFIANGTEDTEAKLLTQRLSHGLPGYLLTVIAENPLPLAQLQKFVRLGNLGPLRDTTISPIPAQPLELSTASLPLNLNREYYRAALTCALSEPLLAEPFSLKDLYIPLKGRVVRDEEYQAQEYSSSAPGSSRPVDLMQWAMSQLDDKTSIAVIEAAAGGGKTSFCQIWAAHVAQVLYPNWMPVLIRLRDATLGQTLEQTLESAFPVGRFTDTDGWFSPNSPPCLLILDGVDELPRSTQTERHLWTFMEQVMRFHNQDTDSTGLPRHKIFLTSRRATLDGLIKKSRQTSTLYLPDQLHRIVVEPMGQDEFRQWFGAWAKLQSKSIAQAYFSFLKHGGAFKQRSSAKDLASLVTRPLMLYLLGVLHRDSWIDESIFQMGSPQVQFEIYDRITRWLLGEPATGEGPLPELIREGFAHASRSLEAIANLLQGRDPQELRRQMQLAALMIIQTGQYQVSSDAIAQGAQALLIAQRAAPEATVRHSSNELTTKVSPPALPALFFRSQPLKGSKVGRLLAQRRNSYENVARVESLKYNLQPANLQPTNLQPTTPAPSSTLSSPTHSVEFSHPSLGEYLGAEAIAKQLTALTQKVPDQYNEITFVLHDALSVAQHLYALLGYGILSAEIEALVVERLRREQRRNSSVFSFSLLFQRLYRFYRAYCRGQWMDEGVAHQAHSQLSALNNPLNVLQIDAAVGINVFLLLCSGAQEAQIPFWPCGNPDIPQEFDPDLLLSFMGRTAALSPTAFWQRARGSLRKMQLAEACLNQAMLAEANLGHANLSAAELIGINLASAELHHANLSCASLAGANLSNANLFEANLEGADLSGANLKGANLKSANLTHTCLFQTKLDEPSKDFAIHSGAIFSSEEFQAYKQSLTPTKILGKVEDDESLGEETPIFMESAEGELVLPEARYSNERNDNDYEGETARIEDEDIRPEISAFSDPGYGESDDEYGDQETAIANPLDYP
ncbi:pentapeptide repeat-containing protein [Allocoleopsis sp.]|uniref:pentapeptide repeat-containing protein n=1 Tax=Allocoleopsis sp. TaxID=3088169 RepID=UPI002FD6C3E1